MSKKIFFLFFLVFCFVKLDAKEIDYFYPWNNTIGQLENISENEVIPILKDGVNYRVVRINKFKGNSIDNINVTSNLAKVEIYFLPIIKNYNNNQILDVMIPLKINEKIISDRSSRKYFLIKFQGEKSGFEKIDISFTANKVKYNMNFDVRVAKQQFEPNLNFNVWVNFDKNFLLKGVKNQVMSDLMQHHVNTIVIPPHMMPEVGNISADRINRLKTYLTGTNNKFDYYILYLGGFVDRENTMMSTQWKKDFPIWYKNIMAIFKEYNIPTNKILLYPIDEPRGDNIKKIDEIHDYLNKIKIDIPIYCTVNSKASAYLAKKLEYIQVPSFTADVIDEISSLRKNKAKIWIYETSNFAKSRNNSPLNYLNIGFKAYYYDADGIGIWNYADVSKMITSKGLKEFNTGTKGSWEVELNKPVYDFSLIYRKGNNIYSSIRWEALSYSLENSTWLKLYEHKQDKAATKDLVNKLLSKKLYNKKWEAIKLSLIN